MKRFCTLSFALILAACVNPLDPTEKTECRDDADCLDGYRCETEVCVELTSDDSVGMLGTNNGGLGGLSDPDPSDELPGAREALLDSIGRSCGEDAECADGLFCVEGSCVCCADVSENPFGSGYSCDAELTPSEIDECVPRYGRPDADELPELGESCGADWECAGDLRCTGDISCQGGGTFQGCEGEKVITYHCMCCIRVMSSEDSFGAFDCSTEPEFYREHCE